MSPSVPNVVTAPVSPAVGTVRVLIVDDEPLARDCMRLALRHAVDVQIVGECGDGASAVDAIRQHSPDIVFLDVQMPGLDGFAVLEQIDTPSMPVVVFVTAFDSHAIRAFEVHALDCAQAVPRRASARGARACTDRSAGAAKRGVGTSTRGVRAGVAGGLVHSVANASRWRRTEADTIGVEC